MPSGIPEPRFVSHQSVGKKSIYQMSHWLSHTVKLLGEDDLSLQAANSTKLAYDDWIEVEFQMAREDGFSELLTVPILMGNQDNQQHLIIGFNAIEEVIKWSSNSSASDILPQILNYLLPSVKGRVSKNTG